MATLNQCMHCAIRQQACTAEAAAAVHPLRLVQVELKKGETLMIDASLHLPATYLHEAFSNRSGVPPDHFELYYRGKRLEGEAALASWGVEKDSAIEVKMRGRGGGCVRYQRRPRPRQTTTPSILLKALRGQDAPPRGHVAWWQRRRSRRQ